MYVIQQKFSGKWKKWGDKRYNTLSEAKAEIEKYPIFRKTLLRVAEEYTVTHYRAIKA